MIVLIYQILLLDFPKYIPMRKINLIKKPLYPVKSSLVEFGPGVLKTRKWKHEKLTIGMLTTQTTDIK